MSVVEKRTLKLEEVLGLVSLSSATVYRMMSQGEFPRPVRIGVRAARWRSDEVEEWLASVRTPFPKAQGERRRCVDELHDCQIAHAPWSPGLVTYPTDQRQRRHRRVSPRPGQGVRGATGQ